MYRPNIYQSRTDDTVEIYDPDLTPKPLRIAKRGSLRNSESVNTSRVLSASSTNRASIPTRTSSVSSTHTPSELPQSNHGIKGSQWISRDTSLHLDKRRQGNSVSTSIATTVRSGTSESSASSRPGGRPRRWGMSSMSDNQSENSAIEAKATVTPSASAVRAFSTKNERPLPAPSTPPVPQRRAVTDLIPIRGGVEATRHVPDKGLRRQPSSKKGFITRVMSNLTHRSHSGPAIEATKQSISRHSSNAEIPASNLQYHEITESMGRMSDSSGRTGQSHDDDLDDALAAFPTPPTSIETSPRVSERYSISQAEAQRYRRLRRPGHAPVLGADLKLTAERDALDFDGQESILVAVDVEGAVNLTPSDNDLWSQHTGLDIVVILDNS